MPYDKCLASEIFLYAFAPQHEVIAFFKTHATSDERGRLESVIQSWKRHHGEVAALCMRERNIAETIRTRDLSAREQAYCETFLTNPQTKRTFSALPWKICMVEVDKMVAPQRSINLDYVQELQAAYRGCSSEEMLFKFCLDGAGMSSAIHHLETMTGGHVFSSRSMDLRFLGSRCTAINAEEGNGATIGGNPRFAITSYIGFGATPINAYQIGTRVVLYNGFHRVYALRKMGHLDIPLVVQQVSNPMLELPPIIVSLPREYLLTSPRPALVGDFFREGLTVELKVNKRLRTVTWGANAVVGETPYGDES